MTYNIYWQYNMPNVEYTVLKKKWFYKEAHYLCFLSLSPEGIYGKESMFNSEARKSLSWLICFRVVFLFSRLLRSYNFFSKTKWRIKKLKFRKIKGLFGKVSWKLFSILIKIVFFFVFYNLNFQKTSKTMVKHSNLFLKMRTTQICFHCFWIKLLTTNSSWAVKHVPSFLFFIFLFFFSFSSTSRKWVTKFHALI